MWIGKCLLQKVTLGSKLFSTGRSSIFQGRVLNLFTTGILGPIRVCYRNGGRGCCLLNCKMFSNKPVLYLLVTSSIPAQFQQPNLPPVENLSISPSPAGRRQRMYNHKKGLRASLEIMCYFHHIPLTRQLYDPTNQVQKYREAMKNTQRKILKYRNNILT